MRAGGSKHKGAQFERKTCAALSLWITNNERDDCFWRSSMSGGRATIRGRKGKQTKSQEGDISAISPEGHAFLSVFLIECKNYRDLEIVGSLLHGKGLLAKFWQKLRHDARNARRRPLLIVKQNNFPTLALLLPVDAPHYFGISSSNEMFRAYLMEERGVSVYRFDKLLSDDYHAARFDRGAG